MDEKFLLSHKVYNYTFNFMAMSCLLQLIILWHLSKATRLFFVTCVHYNYKWITNSVIDFQIFSSVFQHGSPICDYAFLEKKKLYKLKFNLDAIWFIL